jgi:putative ABC transport system permease protein
MLIENMKMAFSAIRSNKMRSALTMLGIIIGIGSVIAIVSIGDTMRGLFSDLYKDVGITQAYVSIGYWMMCGRAITLTWTRWSGPGRRLRTRWLI